ncbi:MAG: hypothetical protein ABI333_08290 [bacterium]
MKRAYCLGLTVFVCLSAAGLVAGCSVTESTNVETSGIWARYVVEHDAQDRVTAWGTLRVGGPLGTIVDLVAGEHLEVNGTEMTEWYEPITDYHWSRAIVAPTADGRYDIDFVRTDSVVPSTVVMPERPTITDATPFDLVETHDTLTVYWDNSAPGDAIEITVEGDCIERQEHDQVPETGEFTTDPINDRTLAQTEDCLITVTVLRWVYGFVSSSFNAGLTEAYIMDEHNLIFETIY